MKNLIRSAVFFPATVFFGIPVDAQDVEPLSADRPDQTEASSLVPAGYVQAEAGFSRERVGPGETSASIPGLLLRYGLLPGFELRMAGEYVLASAGGAETGLTPLSPGVKIRLFDERGSIPQTALIGHISIPKAASPAFAQTTVASSLRFAMSHTVTEELSIGYNAGAEWDGAQPGPVLFYTLVGGFSITEMVGCFAEVYGSVPRQGMAEHQLDGGFTWLLSPDLMLDLAGGIGLSAGAPDHFVGAGVSFRLDTRPE